MQRKTRDRIQFGLAVFFKIIELLFAPIWMPARFLWEIKGRIFAFCIVVSVLGVVIWAGGKVASSGYGPDLMLAFLTALFIGIMVLICFAIICYIKEHWKSNYRTAGKVLDKMGLK